MLRDMTRKLPVLGRPSPASAQRELAVQPVSSGSRPEFPTRGQLARKAGQLGGATLLATGLAGACGSSKPAPAPMPVAEPMPTETPAKPEPTPAPEPAPTQAPTQAAQV